MQLRYLKNIELYKSSKVKQNNGAYVNTYTLVNTYQTEFQELNDEVSASVYGATVNKMYRISSPTNKLEAFLKDKLNDSTDNLSQYFIKYNSAYYKISTVKTHWLDIEYKEAVGLISA